MSGTRTAPEGPRRRPGNPLRTPGNPLRLLRTLRERLGDWWPTRLDLLLSLAVAIAGLVESFGRQGPEPGQVQHPVVMAAGAAAAGTLLLFRRRFPAIMLLVLIATGLAVRVVAGEGYYAAWHFYSTLILVHTVASAAELRSRRGLAGLGCVLAAYAFLQTLQSNDVAEVMISAIFVGVAYGSGILLRRQIDRTLRLAERTTRLEVEREERARRAVEEERARIARELHDVVSHNVSVMTLHAGGVRMLLGDDRARERDMLLGVERAGREAIEELQLMLGVLRDYGGPGPGPETHRPGLDRLDELLAQVREAGLDVRLRTAGEPRPLPEGLSLSAYRVVQEALTNVRKHAPAARAGVVIGYGPAELVVEVVDDGAAPAPDAVAPASGGGEPADRGHGPAADESGSGSGSRQAPGGHGLIGMRERVAMHGGELSAGPVPGGGYRVAARFPLSGPSGTC
ncbi:two-component sensor histidine kinase [Planobispora rosea]|uniref:histidine kinase n=1 Tax=Planobispora rosea TaxID=35762 RepID=A0A8J3S5J6_PLARO|nr:histidine kinase [Planobispora rosea]GGS93008.1 two-component sensor histidine kinase [Planobispora rosea]GIH87194.1 two-component sensor histidine kinase [Planobispora rosea]